MDEIRALYAFNRWANLQFLAALEGLSDEELHRDMKSSFPSVLATLVHLLGAEWVWLERWLGRSPQHFPDAAALDSVAAVRARWDALWAEQRTFLAGLGDGDAGRPVAYRNFAGNDFTQPLGELLRHVVNHATYHRGQLTTLLRQLGHGAPSTDLVTYYRTRPAVE
ncbi:MAG: hypothetical protein AMXMBFR53_03180 [Gemmatimonadota bacterium]